MFPSLRQYLIQKPVAAFFVLTFLIAWAIWLPLGILAPEQTLLTLPGAWAPTISAAILIRFSEGREGVRNLLKKVFRWRVDIGWYLVVLFGVAALAYLGIGLGMIFGVPAPQLTLPAGLPRSALIAFLPLFFVANIFMGGPLAEDIGWRGYILPKMREEMPALKASLILGVIWAIWHLPFFLFPGWRLIVGGIPFLWFALLTASWSVLFAWVYVNTESILMPVLFHAAINTTLGTLGLLGHGEGSMLPLVIHTLLTWLAVGIVSAVYGTDLKRDVTYPAKNADDEAQRFELR